jgi:endoglucanase
MSKIKNKEKIYILLLSFLTALTFAGCAGKPPEAGEIVAESNEHQFESLFSEAEIDYVVPLSVPNIMINQLGYLTGSVKMAVFRGENLPGHFQVINADTGRTIYTGEIENRGYNAITGEYLSYGNFTEVKDFGNYYLEAQVVGRSYSFAIGEDLYDGAFILAGRQYYLNRCGISLTEEYAGKSARSACHVAKVLLREDAAESLDVTGGWHQDLSGSQDIVTAANVVSNLLLSYELNPELYGDDTNIPESGNQIPDILDEIRYQIEWMRKMQDIASGGVYAGVSVYPSGNDTSQAAGAYSAFIEPVSAEATKMFCAAMAKFSYLYQGFDNAFATECLQAADRAWRYLNRNHTDLLDEMYFQAAAEMYRAAGYQSYHNVIVQYLNSEDYQNLFGAVSKNTGDARQESITKGAVTYLLTKKRVDKNLCSEIMKTITLMAEDISARASLSQYLTAGNAKQDNNGELLADMFFLAIVNHVITNHEYGMVIENHLHYFMGRNSAGISYIDEIGELNYKELDNRLGIMNQIESNSKLLFMVSGIKSNAIVEN